MLREDTRMMFEFDDEEQKRYPRIKCLLANHLSSSLFDNDAEYQVLVEDNVITTTKDFVLAFTIMFAAYYIFNLAYPSKLSGTLAFIQKLVLQIGDKAKVKPKVLTLIGKLKNM